MEWNNQIKTKLKRLEKTKSTNKYLEWLEADTIKEGEMKEKN